MTPIILPQPLSGKASGHPSQFLPGSGRAATYGLERLLQYRDLYMHDRSVLDYYRVKSVDGLNDADVRDTREANPGDHGETPFNSFYGGRTIVISGEIVAHNVQKMRDMQDALRSTFVDIKNEYPLYIRTGDPTLDSMINCKKIGRIEGIEQQDNFKTERPFQITLRASNPRILGYQQKSVTTGATFVSTGTEIIPAQNDGNFEAQPIYTLAGPQTDATIINQQNGQTFVIASIPSGRTFFFDISKKKLYDDLGVNKYDELSDDSDYVLLEPETVNQIEITASGRSGASAVGVLWRDTWI